ncbi:ABC transporter ATP-binding protein [Oscillatoria acuminata]|uniref:Carbohydrate ABC transporter ATP-binding protein, CUT1 family n=1 Tax=Oscillatoria acuminata PCC 6304 TaxID=56110 RepID=K9TMR9_9CYAN|nr:ATP-binding cassette domain-containing protein [Oscillatoria acuminata]AFY83441.1 carbohydrate ABC transporter ATP-binding protein, CUT1 family [Oscillatoria acuminata PCC 6304]
MARVVIENVYKSYGDRREKSTPVPPDGILGTDDTSTPGLKPAQILRRINLTVEDGEFMVLVGPSGCGKSTLLRLIAGLEELTAGNIWVGDRLLNDLPPKDRDIAMVFQNYALYPHLKVYDNIAFGLRRTLVMNEATSEGTEVRDDATSVPNWAEDALVSMTRNLPKYLRYLSPKEREVDQRVRTVAGLLQIEALLDRLPKQLSGGQKQRVALGRAMARNPQVFLMDEPLSNLDAKLRAETRSQIVKLQRQLETTTIYVTHDQTEAMTMGDRIAVMNAGQIQQIAAPLELYHRPANLFVAEFIGSPPMNFIPVQFKAPLSITHDSFRFTLPEYWGTALQGYDGRSLILGIRPEHLSVSPAATKNMKVKVDLVEALGSETYIVGTLPDHDLPKPIQARIEPDWMVHPGEEIWLAIALEKIHLFDQETGRAILASDR